MTIKTKGLKRRNRIEDIKKVCDMAMKDLYDTVLVSPENDEVTKKRQV